MEHPLLSLGCSIPIAFEAGNSGILSDPALGITEFTNGNFLSRSTIFRDFALPRASDLVLEQPIDELIDGSVERYYSKPLRQEKQ